MNDNEIIKALECCIAGDELEVTVNSVCDTCPMDKECDEDCNALIKNALDLINRKNAEIESKEDRIRALNDTNKILMETQEIYAKNMINEFAERVKPIFEELFDLMIDDDEGKCIIEDCKKHSSIPCMNEYCIRENKDAWLTKIDNLLKEMVGDDNG